MADRTVTARLRLVHSEFTKGARTAAKDVTDLGHKVSETSKRTNQSWGELGKRTADLGSKMTQRITLPIVALGGAAVKMANDFGNVFTQMEATAGVAADEVDGLKDQVLGLAGETGRGPQELAEALLLIRSSGYEGAAAMDVLETSARGAAAGMGTTAEIANALTNVISGYGEANITAAEAMDVLTQSVTEGKAEASEMAPQFGRLVPIAAELGVEFSELGGIMAFLTKPTGDAALSATQLSGVLAKMLEPGVEGAEALEAVGMSAEGLRASIREKGLHQTLIDLRKNLEDNGMKLNDFAVDQQFLQGALLLTGASAEDAADIIESVGDSAGAADEAFEKWGRSLGAKNSKAWATAQAAMIQFGDVALPMVATLAEHISSLIQLFADLPEGVQEVIVILAAMAAMMGPLASAGGKLMQMWEGLSKMTAGGFAATTIAAGTMAITVGAVIYGLNQLVAKNAETKKRIEDFADALGETGAQGRVAAEDLLMTGLTAGELGEKLVRSGADLESFVDEMKDGADKAGDLEDRLRRVAGQSGIGMVSDELDKAADSGNKFAQQIQEIARAQDLSDEEILNLLERIGDISNEYEQGAEKAKVNAAAQEAVAEGAADAGLVLDEQGNIVDATAQKIEDLTTALDELLGRYLTVDESVRRQNELMIGLEAHFDEMREKYAGNALELNNNTAAGIANADMLDDLITASGDTISKMVEQGATSEDLRAQWAQDRGELALVIEKFRTAGQDVSTYDSLLGEIDRFVATTVNTPGLSSAQSGLSDLYQKILQIDGSSVTININERRNTSTGRIGGVPVMHKGGVVPGRRGEEVAAVLLAGERVLSVEDPLNKMLSAPMVSAMSHSGGQSGPQVNIDLRGAVTPDSRQLVRLVTYAINRGMRTTRSVNVA